MKEIKPCEGGKNKIRQSVPKFTSERDGVKTAVNSLVSRVGLRVSRKCLVLRGFRMGETCSEVAHKRSNHENIGGR